MTEKWYPHHTQTVYQPPTAGRLIGRDHAVWQILKVTNSDLSDRDREMWLDAGAPDLATWKGRPYSVDLRWVAGARPPWNTDDDGLDGCVEIPAGRSTWHLYPESGRWPSCSCCGEPMPCRAELQDQEVSAGLNRVEKLASRQPGCCWGCGEPITRRQKAVVYPGDNLDLPGGIPVAFHARESCHGQASAYELRWIALDPRRERILTYPKCRGILIVHADGSSECQSGQDAIGTYAQGEPDCRGHLTHDHGSQSACYVGGAWFATKADMPGCPRGCSKGDAHPGTRTKPRPPRPQPDSAALFDPTHDGGRR
ncbi:hypothetical protein ACH4T9_12495 [Micromonospora sp. NPDC020750]|uniref:hypothetical protein n=1 Tax=unclassified Micromonospora TaxID=2617518 RepID=UPI0037993200